MGVEDHNSSALTDRNTLKMECCEALCRSDVASLLHFIVFFDENKWGDCGSTRSLSSEALRVELKGAQFP